MELTTIVLFGAGLLLLLAGAEALVRGAVRLAARLGIAPLIIGLTVVAFGTSSPEIAVSVRSGLAGQGDIALGNVIGSNLFNILFILGLSALITPLLVSRQLIRLDVPVMVGVSILMLLLSLNTTLGRGEGLLLLLGLITYLAFLMYNSRRESSDSLAAPPVSSPPQRSRSWFIDLLLVIGGLGLLILGAQWLVDSATAVARLLGISELIIGLTVVAAGTSLPEVATSVVASLRGERDIAVGNVVGSNIFNILGVLGLTALTAPGEIQVADSLLRFDIPIMIAAAIACLPVFFTGYSIARWEGALFLGYYLAYAAYLILESTRHQTLPIFSKVMLLFVIPLTVLTLLTVTVRAIRASRSPNDPSS